ncbi:MAG: hypothetical protein AB7K09_15195 [Planctomycetota bacterium]
MVALIAASVLFEAHVRLAMQYLQPCLKLAQEFDLKLIGAAGAMAEVSTNRGCWPAARR